jgi:energy-coupling factor transporter ATP-binding protein EcfA2/energy-coupling factor transporter transmembrane protein EcfT
MHYTSLEMTVQQSKPRPSGLGLLPPAHRLAVVFLFSVFYIFVNDLALAALVLLIGVAVFFLSCRERWKLSLAAVTPGLILLVYNAILSPPAAGGFRWWVFTLNQAGVTRGLVTGMRLIGVMLISFAWLAVTSIPEMYTGLAWIKPIRAWVLELLRGVQIVRREFIALTQSLIIRGMKWDSPLANIKNLVPLAMAIIPRVADNAQKTTFALQSHQPPKAVRGPEAGLAVERATVRYSPRLPDVLHEVDMRVEPGEFIYLAGTDRAGKTTLLRLLGGVIPRIMGEFKGRVRVDGLVTHEVALSDLCNLARYVASEPFSSIYGLTVGQEISFLAKDEAAARRYLGIMGIEALWERETTKLSGGQQVRLVLAGALASQAKYLLLDAPMQELDPAGRRDFMEALKTLCDQGEVTVLVADPFWQQLAPFARRAIVLEDGRATHDLAAQAFFQDSWLQRCHLVGESGSPAQSVPGAVVARLEGVHVALEGTPILHGIDLQVSAGELLAIMGPNGSGKTTAMLTLAGAIRPSQGRVSAKGQMAYVFQDARLQAVADTVRNELALGPNILKWPPAAVEAFVRQGLEWTGIDPDACPLDLHPAEARMLAIAACNTDAAVLILDEPTVGLDAHGVQKLMGLVAQLLTAGKAVIVVTHDEAVAHLAHRIVVIQDGLVAGDQPRPPSQQH